MRYESDNWAISVFELSNKNHIITTRVNTMPSKLCLKLENVAYA
jgi:hypothetical protein